MKRFNRPAVIALAYALAVGAAAWGWFLLADASASATAAAQDARSARLLVERIEALRRTTAAVAASPQDDLRQRIARAATAAGVAQNGLEAIEEQPVSRSGDGAYQERPTRIVLRQVTLRQVVTFFHSLTAGAPAYHARELRLTAPREQERGGHWSA